MSLAPSKANCRQACCLAPAWVSPLRVRRRRAVPAFGAVLPARKFDGAGASKHDGELAARGGAAVTGGGRGHAGDRGRESGACIVTTRARGVRSDLHVGSFQSTTRVAAARASSRLAVFARWVAAASTFARVQRHRVLEGGRGFHVTGCVSALGWRLGGSWAALRVGQRPPFPPLCCACPRALFRG